MLLVSSAPLPHRTAEAVARLRHLHGGQVVEPLHITCDRFAATSDGTAVLLEHLARAARSLSPVDVRSASLTQLRRPGGRVVLKYVVEETPALARIRALVHEASDAASLQSAYGADAGWTVSAVEDYSGDVAAGEIPPTSLFRADRFLVSRIVAEHRFETVRTFDFSARP